MFFRLVKKNKSLQINLFFIKKHITNNLDIFLHNFFLNDMHHSKYSNFLTTVLWEGDKT
jgi:uncharacterized membrane protein YwzB